MGRMTKFLPKVTKTSSKDALTVLQNLALRLPSPNNYLLGKALSGHVVPANILCFCRRSAEKITRFSTSFHRDHHHRFVLLISLAGEGKVSVDTGVHNLRALDAVLIFPFQFHHYFSVRPESIRWLFITFEMSHSSNLEFFFNRTPWKIASGERDLLSKFLQGCLNSKETTLPSLYLAALLEHWKLRLPSAVPPAAKPRRKSTGPLAEMTLIEHVNSVAFLESKQSLTSKTLAKRLGYSSSHLRARFLESTGLSLGRHLRELKLQQACSLLHKGELNISSVAEKCGFSSIYSFSRAFRKFRGISPMQYRKKQRIYQKRFQDL
jgi:AraC-like DNA-binding protein